jgi:hypothetical protein
MRAPGRAATHQEGVIKKQDGHMPSKTTLQQLASSPYVARYHPGAAANQRSVLEAADAAQLKIRDKSNVCAPLLDVQ